MNLCYSADNQIKTIKVNRSVWPQHVLWPDPLLELFLREVAEIESLLLQSRPVLVGSLGNLGGLVVANVRVESCDQHERLVHQLVDLLLVGLNPHHAVVSEGGAGVSDQSDGSQNVGNHHRPH